MKIFKINVSFGLAGIYFITWMPQGQGNIIQKSSGVNFLGRQELESYSLISLKGQSLTNMNIVSDANKLLARVARSIGTLSISHKRLGSLVGFFFVCLFIFILLV